MGDRKKNKEKRAQAVNDRLYIFDLFIVDIRKQVQCILVAGLDFTFPQDKP